MRPFRCPSLYQTVLIGLRLLTRDRRLRATTSAKPNARLSDGANGARGRSTRDARGCVNETERIRAVLLAHGRLSVPVESLADHDVLYQAGLTSLASVNVMLALEEAFDIEFPDRMLSRAVFENIAAMQGAIAELTR